MPRLDDPRPVNRPCRRACDHRLRDLACEERDPGLLAELAVPCCTAASWVRRGSRSIVTTELFGQDDQALGARVLKLDRRVALLLGIVRPVFAVIRLFGFRLDSQRVPSGKTKSSVLASMGHENRTLADATTLGGLLNDTYRKAA